MYDLPPSAFIHSGPRSPRRRRGPIYLALALALAVGTSGIIGYSAGYAADTGTEMTPPLAVRAVVVCRPSQP
jgi:hypothetical protein